MQVIRHITIPCLLPTYFVLLMLQVAGFLNNGMELVLRVPERVQQGNHPGVGSVCLQPWRWRRQLSVSVAISMLKSVISVVLLVHRPTACPRLQRRVHRKCASVDTGKRLQKMKNARGRTGTGLHGDRVVSVITYILFWVVRLSVHLSLLLHPHQHHQRQ
jgi:ABC-type polysaccharide transport system permease subunit